MTIMRKMVVLSGGFDSVALLHHALEEVGEHGDVRAVSFDYSQPHRDQELAAAQMIAGRCGLTMANHRWERVRITELGPFDVTPGYHAPAVANAFVPVRNLIFLAYAANRAARAWPGEESEVLYGANQDDAAGFADCRRGFVAQASAAVQQSLSGFAGVSVRAPWVDRSWKKEDILGWAAGRPEVLDDLRLSMSCYVGTRCGRCDSCTRRRKAFEAVGLEDGDRQYRTTGGDPAREVSSATIGR